MAATLPRHAVAIEVKNLTFAYPGGRLLYHGADLEVPANAVTLIHGESGAGKSTLISLLLRFVEPREGGLTIGGVDIRLVPGTELRRYLGVVPQSHFIFEDTLRENLLIAKSNASDQQIEKALDQALLGDFLRRQPHGLDTGMAPGGRNLSAGERQRLSLARLFLRGAPILIMDEPWSNLDQEAADTLARLLNGCKAMATVLILTHHHPAALQADRVYYLDSRQGLFVAHEVQTSLGKQGA